jgi:hypothetical protein
VSNTCQKTGRRAQPDPPADEVNVARAGGRVDGLPRQGGEGGLLALAVGTGLQVMAAMLGEDVTRPCGPGGKHNTGRAGYRHRTDAGHPRRAPRPGDTLKITRRHPPFSGRIVGTNSGTPRPGESI